MGFCRGSEDFRGPESRAVTCPAQTWPQALERRGESETQLDQAGLCQDEVALLMDTWCRWSVVERLHVNPDCGGYDWDPLHDLAARQRLCATRGVVQESERGFLDPPHRRRRSILIDRTRSWHAEKAA